jgi:hypothetical protein
MIYWYLLASSQQTTEGIVTEGDFVRTAAGAFSIGSTFDVDGIFKIGNYDIFRVDMRKRAWDAAQVAWNEWNAKKEPEKWTARCPLHKESVTALSNGLTASRGAFRRPIIMFPQPILFDETPSEDVPGHKVEKEKAVYPEFDELLKALLEYGGTKKQPLLVVAGNAHLFAETDFTLTGSDDGVKSHIKQVIASGIQKYPRTDKEDGKWLATGGQRELSETYTANVQSNECQRKLNFVHIKVKPHGKDSCYTVTPSTRHVLGMPYVWPVGLGTLGTLVVVATLVAGGLATLVKHLKNPNQKDGRAPIHPKNQR